MNESKNYRSELAKKLHTLRSIDEDVAENFLAKAKETGEYQEAKKEIMQKRAQVFELKNKVISQEVGITLEKDNNSEKADVVNYVKESLSEFFEVQEISGSQIKVVLKDQMQFKKWPDVLNRMKEKSILNAEFFDPQSTENDGVIIVTNPMVYTNGDSSEFNITIRFDKGGIDEGLHKKIKEDKDTFATAHIMSIVKPEAITMHPGMLHSISVQK